MNGFAYKNESKMQWWICLFISIMCAINMIPYLSRNASLILQFFILVVVPLVNYRNFSLLNKKEKNIFYLILIYIGVESFYKFLDISTASIDYYFTTIKFFWLYVIFRITKNSISLKEDVFLVFVIIASCFYTIITNIKYAGLNEHYIAMFLSDPTSNAANTAYATGVMLLGGLSIIIFLSSIRKAIRIPCLAFFIFCFYYLIFIAERGTTFLLALFMVFLIFLNLRENNQSRGLIMYSSFIVIFTVFYTGFLSSILELLSSILPDRLSVRMEAINNVINGSSVSEAGSSISSRQEVILQSLRTFFGSTKAFFFGVGDVRINNDTVGNHSQWIDSFARYGIFTGSLLLYIVRGIFNVWKKDYVSRSFFYRGFCVLFTVFVLRGIIGNVLVPSIGTVLFIVIPCVYRIMNRYNYEILDL